jgi:hypothetical protein
MGMCRKVRVVSIKQCIICGYFVLDSDLGSKDRGNLLLCEQHFKEYRQIADIKIEILKINRKINKLDFSLSAMSRKSNGTVIMRG